ncbi:MAG: HEAT repeat protein [Chlamydiales bacterium]|jgi:HEAT repeat protein
MGLFGFFKKHDKQGPGPELLAQIQAWISDLGDQHWETRLRACDSLGELGPVARRATPKLQELIVDEHGDVCLAAARALSNIERGL